METPAEYVTAEPPSDSLEDRRQQPWAMVETSLLRDPRIPPQCKALYGLLITYGPQRIFPGQQTLADCLGTTRQTVIRWLSDLKDCGLIGWDRRVGTSNKYYILGYANFQEGCNTSVTGDVTWVLQGCNTSVTGDVTPVLQDLEPFNQKPFNENQEQEPLAADPVAAFKSRHSSDPFDLALECAEARAQVEHPDFSDPQADVDLWETPFRVFCISFLPGADVDRMPRKKRKQMVHEIRRLAEEVQAGPQQAVEAIRALASLEAWLVGPSATPFNTRWAEGFQNTLIADADMLAAQVASKRTPVDVGAVPGTKRHSGRYEYLVNS